VKFQKGQLVRPTHGTIRERFAGGTLAMVLDPVHAPTPGREGVFIILWLNGDASGETHHEAQHLFEVASDK